MINKKNTSSIGHYRTLRRDVRYPRLEYKTGSLVLILPIEFEKHEELIEKHKDWIEKKKVAILTAMQALETKVLEKPFTEQEMKRLVNEEAIAFCTLLHTNINNILFRNMKTKWGSCSSRKNLTINSSIRYLPKNLVSYVVFHEILHTIERKHNQRFWTIVESKFPNYKENENDLFTYWFLVQKLGGQK